LHCHGNNKHGAKFY